MKYGLNLILRLDKLFLSQDDKLIASSVVLVFFVIKQVIRG